uniref:Small ribosomal subunit protein eS19 n=2 Tax=Macrostomum lignano TaxID=282301 RepID=A0A1I8GDP5_9PLAT
MAQQAASGKSAHTFVGVKSVSQQKLVRALAAYLKKTGKLAVPEWADVVKLSAANELAPADSDWFFVRSASLLRHLYVRAPVGVGALTKVYGKVRRRGHRPNHSSRCYRGPLRKSLQGLESMGLVAKDEAGGRQLTSQGRRDLDRIAYQVYAEGHKKV